MRRRAGAGRVDGGDEVAGSEDGFDAGAWSRGACRSRRWERCGRPSVPGSEWWLRGRAGRRSGQRGWWRCSLLRLVPRMASMRLCRRWRSSRSRADACCRRGGVAEVDAAGALEQVAGGGGHVAELGAGAGEQGLREDGVVARRTLVVWATSELRQARRCEVRRGRRGDLVRARWLMSTRWWGARRVASSVDEVGAAGEELAALRCWRSGMAWVTASGSGAR